MSPATTRPTPRSWPPSSSPSRSRTSDGHHDRRADRAHRRPGRRIPGRHRVGRRVRDDPPRGLPTEARPPHLPEEGCLNAMANEIIMTVCGNLTADPELRYTQNGLQVANFTVAQTPRTFDKAKNAWVDGEAIFLRCSVWREYAEHVTASLTKGMRVIATGRYKQRAYEDREGN